MTGQIDHCYGEGYSSDRSLDDENARKDPGLIADLGTIQVTAVRSVYKGLLSSHASDAVDAPVIDVGPLHETAKKGGLHRVKCVHATAVSRNIDRQIDIGLGMLSSGTLSDSGQMLNILIFGVRHTSSSSFITGHMVSRCVTHA